MASMAYLLAAILLLACASCINAQRTLVLLESAVVRESHSNFFSMLSDAGFTLKFAMADSPSLSLQRYGERIFDHLIVFAPSVEKFGGSLSTETLVEFLDNGGNVLIAGSSDIGEALQDFASEVGFEFDDTGNRVNDHISNADDDHTLITSKNLIDVDVMTGGKQAKPILFRGIGMIADDENELTVPVLRASSTAYTGDADGVASGDSLALGRAVILVGAMQARNNARVVLAGSIDMFSNALLSHSDGSNNAFVKAIALWCFQERGQLRSGTALHHLVGENSGLHEYTIKQDVEYLLPIEEKMNGKWVPFTGKDVQLEFVRIDPFVRTTLKNVNGIQQTQFKLPDVYGVFQFRVDYVRPGYSEIHNVQQVSVRPLRHTEYDRFIPTAYPYYTSAFSMMAGLFLFSIVFLHHRA